MAETEAYKKVEKVVIEKVVGRESQQLFYFRDSMPAGMLDEQKTRRAKFTEKHRAEKSANTTERGLVLVNEKAAKVWSPLSRP